MTADEKKQILEKAKEFFKEKIIKKHLSKIKEAENPNSFTPNPFLQAYLAKVAFGDTSKKSLAKAMIYPRVLGTSINTMFGTHMQTFCTEVLGGFGSMIPGLDIEFEDQIDGRRKYCQIKSGPNCLNTADIKTIQDHFNGIQNLARQNRVENFTSQTDCIVGVLYGTENDLSPMYRAINKSNPVYCGQEFWQRLTGDSDFYKELINCMAECVDEMDNNNAIDNAIERLAENLQ